MLVRRRIKVHWNRVVVVVLPLLLVAIPALAGYAAAAGGPRQPAVAAAGEPAPTIEATYDTAQADPDLTDDAQVRAAVDAYFTLKYESMVQRRALDPGFVIDRTTRAGQDLYNYELGRLQYSIACWEHTDTVLDSYSYRPEYESVTVTGDRATVRVHPGGDAVWADTPDRVDGLGAVPHVIDLVKTADGWKLIRDDYDDEFRTIYPYGTDWAELRDTLEERLAEYYARDAEITGRPPIPAGVAWYRTYDRSRCATYAVTYTDDSGTYSTDNYNPLFKDWAYKERDCQNFVSQCVWYGFGGVNTSSAIEAHDLPMIDGISGATDWWCDKDGTDPNWTWTGVSYFENMIKDNYDDDKVGVYGRDGNLEHTLVGDIVRMTTKSHVFIIDDIVDLDGDGDTDYNEIYISSHTNNRRNHRLSSLIKDPTKVRYIWIVRFKEPE